MANYLMDAGKDILTNRIKGSGTEPVYIGWGAGSALSGVAATALNGGETPIQSQNGRTAGTSSRVTTSVANDTYQVVGTNTAAGTVTITQAGLFDASGAAGVGVAPTGGNMFVAGDGLSIALSASDSIQFTFKVQFT